MARSGLLLALLAAACAASGPAVPEAERTDHPRLVFATKSHDFGRQERRRTLTHTVTFANAGRRPLEILRIDTNCGCAAALVSSRRVAPGGRGSIRVTWQTGDVAGRRTKVMEVTTNDPVDPVSRYPMRIEVIGDAYLDPAVLVVRGTRAQGAVEAHFDVVALDAGKDLSVTEVRTSHEGIRGSAVPLGPGDRRKGFRVNLTFGPSLGTGSFHERVTVLTNSRRDPRLSIDVIGSVRRQVLPVPERLYFPRTDETVVRSVFVSRKDGEPLTVTGVDDPTGLFDLQTRRVSATKWEVLVGLSGESPAAAIRGSLLVRTDAPEDARVAVPFEIAGGTP